MRQLSLFEESFRGFPVKNKVQYEDLYPYIIYIATEKGNCSGIIFECKTLEQARDFCSRNDTKGKYLGVEWAYFFTKKSYFIDAETSIYEYFIKGKKHNNMKSDNRFDNILDEYGLRKIFRL